ncbi:MAG: right-handed parallel beta-helix repeat-containing protein, partial [Myxococcales bacterium]|nr:right-handed parallel beta-helix repeat-containing protein [Myxococcales bacterium]
MPFCDAGTHACRGCIADLECPSLVCDLTPGSANHGSCVPTASVEYVDKSAPAGGTGLTPTTARQKIQDAINHATGGDNRPYVHIAAGSYNENVGVNNGAVVYLVGADGVVVRPTNMDALGAMNGGSLTIRNLVATAPSGNGGNCQGASFKAYDSQFVGSSQNGVYSSNCDLLLDGVWVDSNVGSGVYVNAGNFQVLNSIITRNSNSGGFYQVANGASTVFANNTVADNSASGSSAGVACPLNASTLIVRNTILYNNKGTAGSVIGETNCAGEFDASDDASAGPQSTVDLTNNKKPGFKGGTPVSPDSYHITATSPCRHEATPLYAPDHDFDFEPRSSTMPDIGADEVQ